MSQPPGLAERVQATQAARQQGSGKTVFQALEDPKFKQQIERALPKAISPERFLRLILTECRTNPNLMRCDHTSLLGAAMTAAQLGLEPDVRGLAYLIPRKIDGQWRATFMVGYRGFIDLARRSGQITDIQAHVVYERDEFDFAYGIDPKLRHRPKLDGDRGKRIAVYAVATFKDGGHTFRVLSIDEVEARKGRSAAAQRGQSPWDTDYDAMAAKTALRALAPWLPQTVELAQAAALDEQVRTDYETPLEDAKPEPLNDESHAIPEAELVDHGDAGSESPDGPGEEDTGDAAGAAPTPPPADDSGTAPSGLSEYDALSLPQLRAECVKRGISSPPVRKADCIAALIAHDERPFTEEGD